MVPAYLQLAFYAAVAVLCVLLETSILIYVWLLPYLLGGPFLRAYLLAEHARCPQVASMLENTRTTLSNRCVRWLAWNMPYHAEHHIYPAVPFYKLPEFHQHVKEYITHLEPGYLHFNRYYLKDSLSGELIADSTIESSLKK